MILQYLLEDLEVLNISGKTDIKINKIEYDSKKIEKDDIFIAINGFENNGNDYIDEAIKNGANTVISELDIKNDNITVILVKDTRITMSEMSSKFYGNPKDKLKLIGITGTKGKTTTAYMIRDILNTSGKKVGMIGTIYTTYNNIVIDSTRTSPESLDLHRLLKDMVDGGIEFVVMEVSSHALELNRVYGMHFMTCIFTNLSEEHLDFHKTMDSYLLAKSKLFKMTDFALINGDDKYSNELVKLIDCKIAKFGLDNEVNITAADVRINGSYTEFKMYINKMLETITINIPGRYTVYNALAAIGACSMLNIQMDSIITALSNLKVPGRSEVVNIGKTFTVIVDYAHNPSSMEAILSSTKRYAKGRIITVFGCGGNRDKTKRSVMGQIAGKYSNFTVITTDNPRKEKSSNICKEIELGIKDTSGLYKIIENRYDAISFAMKIAWKNDIVLVLGKGHEDYQILGDKKIHFDDRETVMDIAGKMKDKNIEEEVN